MTALQAARPADLAALKLLLAGVRSPLTYVAGGTDLLVAPREPPREGWLIDISRTGGLAGVSLAGDELQIGATTTLSGLIADPLIRAHVPVLAEAADLCGSVQIRNRATIGGNVANASPAGDLLPVLKCCDAGFVLLLRDGEMVRRSFDETVGRLPPGALITCIVVPLTGCLPRTAFAKLGVRDDLTIARLNLMMAADMAGDGVLRELRLFAGAIAPLPLRLTEAEAALRGLSLSSAVIEAFQTALLAAVDRAIPGRASQGYKRRAIMGLGLDVLEKITGRKELLP